MVIKVKVNTNSRKESIEKVSTDEYVIKFKAVREKGEANKKLITLLSNYFNVPISQIKILNGYTSTIKIVEILVM